MDLRVREIDPGVLDRPLDGVREEAWRSAQGMKIDPGVVAPALPAPP